MNDHAPVLRARSTQAVAPRAAEADAQFDVQMRRARAISQAKDAVPPSYRNNDGAALLAVDFAEHRGLDLVTTVQCVSFISGRPVIDATLQRALAKRAGYRVKVVKATADDATVEVWEDGELLGSATYTIDEARVAGLTSKDNWKKNPKAMLVARATTQAMRWFAPDVMTGVFIEDEVDDAVAVLTADVVGEFDGAGAPLREDGEGSPSPAATPAPSPDDVVDAEVVEPEPVRVSDVDGPCSDSTRIKARAAVTKAKQDGRWPDIANQLAAESIPVAASSWTERNALRVIELAGDPEAGE